MFANKRLVVHIIGPFEDLLETQISYFLATHLSKMGEIPIIGDNNQFLATHPCKMGIPKIIISKGLSTHRVSQINWNGVFYKCSTTLMPHLVTSFRYKAQQAIPTI